MVRFYEGSDKNSGWQQVLPNRHCFQGPSINDDGLEAIHQWRHYLEEDEGWLNDDFIKLSLFSEIDDKGGRGESKLSGKTSDVNNGRPAAPYYVSSRYQYLNP